MWAMTQALKQSGKTRQGNRTKAPVCAEKAAKMGGSPKTKATSA